MAIYKTDYFKFGENLYELVPPLPSETDRGGVIASPKESTDTVEAKLGDDGKLYVKETDLSNYYTKNEVDTNLENNVVSKSGDTMTDYLNFEKTVGTTKNKTSIGVANNGNTYIPHYTDGTLDNYISLSGTSSYTSKPWSVNSGGTGATTAAQALINLGLTATATELNYVDGVNSNIQEQLNNKQGTITGAASTIATTNLTTSRALVSSSTGKVTVSSVTTEELGYLDGVTENVQTQLNNRTAVKIVRWS